jgi:hypothetical protein
MFPISCDRALSIQRIAEYWSREIRPPASPRELREEIIKAWWRRELVVPGGPEPIDVLRSLHKTVDRNKVLFIAPTDVAPPVSVAHEDGSVTVDVRIRIRVPSGSPESWIEENCDEGMAAIAESWDEAAFQPIATGLTAIKLTVTQFSAWTKARGFKRPRFWAHPGRARPASPRRLSDKSARRFAEQYIHGEGAKASQAGLEKSALASGYVGARDALRQAFKAIRSSAGIAVRRGRNSRAKN